MTIRVQYVVGLVALVALTGAIVWLLNASPTAEPDHEQGPPHDQAPPPEMPAPSPWKLTVHTVNGDGKAAQGKAVIFAGRYHRAFADRWVRVRDPDNTVALSGYGPYGGFLPSTGEGMVDGEPNQTIPFRGTVELSLPARADSWVRFDGADGSMALLRVPSNSPETEATVRLGRGPSTVYVMVYDSDWHTPSTAPVQATFNPEDGGGRRDLGSLTPSSGELTIRDLGSGTVVLRPATFRPGDSAPFATAVSVGIHGLRRDGCAVLVVPEKRRGVTVEALVQELPPSTPATRLVLQRVDAPDSISVWAGEALHAGAQRIPLSLGTGDWQCGVVPGGELTISGTDLLVVRSSGSNEFAMHLAPIPQRTELSLTGIDIAYFPLRVVAQSANALSDDDPELYFGPPQWPSARASVPVLPGPTWLVAFGRGANYAATSPQVLEGPSVTMAMQKACVLTVERREWDSTAKPVVVTATIGDATRAATMRPRIVQHGGVFGVVLAASLVLPMGKVMVDGRDVVLDAPAQTIAMPSK